MNLEDFLKNLLPGGGRKKSDGDGGKSVPDANDPRVVSLFRELMDNITETREREEQELGREGMVEKNNPDGLVCALINYASSTFITSPVGTLAILSDRLGGTVDFDKGDPGRFIHQLGHLLFDLGRQWQYETDHSEEGWTAKENAGEDVEVPDVFSSFFEERSDDEPSND